MDRSGQAFLRVKGLYDTQLEENRRLLAENEALKRNRATAPAQPAAPVSSAPAPAAAPAPSVQQVPAVQAALAKIRETYGDEYVNANLPAMTAIAETIVQQAINAARAELAPELARIDQIAAGVEGLHQERARGQALDMNQVFETQMDALHSDWRGIIDDPNNLDFQTFLYSHPLGATYRRLLYPPPGGASGEVQEIAQILDEFKRLNPTAQAAATQQSETERRQAAAAAADVGRVPTGYREMSPQQGGQYYLLSQIIAKGKELANNPAKLVEFTREMEAATAAGQVLDDVHGPYRAPGQAASAFGQVA